jgi:hypothetical protein
MTSHGFVERGQEVPFVEHRIYFKTVNNLLSPNLYFGFASSSPMPMGEHSAELMFANPDYLLVSFCGDKRKIPTM